MISKYVIFNRSQTVPATADITSYLKYSSWLCNYDSLHRLFRSLRLSIFIYLTLNFKEMEIFFYQGDLLSLCLWPLIFSLEGPSFSAGCCRVYGLPDHHERGHHWAPSCLWGSHTGSRFEHLLCTGALQIVHGYRLIPHLSWVTPSISAPFPPGCWWLSGLCLRPWEAPSARSLYPPCLPDSSVWLTLEPLDSIHVKLSFLSWRQNRDKGWPLESVDSAVYWRHGISRVWNGGKMAPSSQGHGERHGCGLTLLWMLSTPRPAPPWAQPRPPPLLLPCPAGLLLVSGHRQEADLCTYYAQARCRCFIRTVLFDGMGVCLLWGDACYFLLSLWKLSIQG